MGEAERQDGSAVTPAGESGDRTPEEIEREIEQTREELGDTVAALTQKADVKGRAKDKVQEVKHSVADKKEEVVGKAHEKKEEFASKAQDATPSSIDTGQVAAAAREKAQEPPYIAGGAFVAGFLLGVIVAKRRSR
jgi:ElaB/YqjD/DUF883 family membrane-anchored ribosome-binding protein